MKRCLLPLLLLPLLACRAQDEGPTFQEAVKEVYAPCQTDAIRVGAATKNLQIVFQACGSNNFAHFAWSPNGLNLYYQHTQGAWVRKDTGENYPLRVGAPRARAAWLNSEVVAYPDADGRKIGVYQVSSHVLSLVELDQVEPEQLSRGNSEHEVLYLASDTPGGVQDVYRLDTNTGEAERAFVWLRDGVEAFSYTPDADIICYRPLAMESVICARGEDGRELVEVKGRVRGTVSPDGRFLLTEGPGEPIPATPMPEGMVRPSFVPDEVVPPSFWVRDLKTDKEVLWEGVHGTWFQWYEAAPYYGSFLLWGFDNQSYNRNVTLGDLRPFLKAQGWDVPARAPQSEPVRSQ